MSNGEIAAMIEKERTLEALELLGAGPTAAKCKGVAVYQEVMRISEQFLGILEQQVQDAKAHFDEFEIHESESALKAVRELVGLFTYMNTNEKVHHLTALEKIDADINGSPFAGRKVQQSL